ncbi:hypothetical protein Y032_0210g2124 [Ancylostoma ceylanicum]|uniref:TRPM SLOG domain-containing protein n=1 Tax=Ancylostoma ceylanicum TaxID=53326 RepID=A0A016SL84_9BILA|nr:hypothetical protein Y032_0210g2124 [Ancylostoma ceylanicum]
MDKKHETAIPSIHKNLEDARMGQVAIDVPNVSDAERDDDDARKRRRHRKRKDDAGLPPMMTAPKHVHGGDWKDMLYLTNLRQKKRGNSDASQSSSFHISRSRAASSVRGGNAWIEHKIKKRECCQFMPSQKYSTRCGCGMAENQHPQEARKPLQPRKFLTLPGGDDETTNDSDSHEPAKSGGRKTHATRWTIGKNTETLATDSYGTIVFEGCAHQSRAQFVRASFDTDPAALSYLFHKIWKLPPPKLVITIHGGLTNFDLQPKLARIFRKGILKAARSTDAWIITSGLNTGVVPHVASALEDLGSTSRSRTRVVSIGVAPWGMLKRRNRFIGTDISVHYAPNQFNKSRLAELNDRHSYFVFADNGTVGRYGSEIILRKRLETYLAQHNSCSIPVVCVVLEGGAFTIKVVHDYITTIPRIPVVVCDGSGRAADLLAFTHHAIGDDGKLSDSVRNQLMSLVEVVFNYDEKNAGRTVRQLIECARQKNLMTVFRLGEQRQEVDHAILTALLKGQNLSSPEQLQLALAWNRADIARSEIFTMGTEWSTQDLHNAMMEALCHDRTDFVQLLLENGVSMHRFLTYGRLEHLYNTDKGPPHTLRSKMGIASKRHRLRLTDVGHAMEDLMGHAYKSNYTKDDFKAKYFVFSNRRQLGYQKNDRERIRSENLKEDKENEHSVRMDLLHTARNSIISIFTRHQNDDDDDELSNFEDESLDFTFKYPYSELLIWAVLTKRQSMAMLMWKHGEEAMAKALVACRLYESLANDASQNYLELEICEELRKNSEEFRVLSIEALQYCTEQDKDITLQLLTYELTNWGNETCLSLAALNNNRQFLAHPCCQLLLSDLWQGGLHIRNNANLKVLGSLLMPAGIFMMEYKTKEELMLQPHTFAEHIEDQSSDSDSSLSDDSSYSDSSSSSSETDHEKVVRQRAGSDRDPVPLSFQQLMRDKLRFSFRKDHLPNGNGIIVPPQVERTRARTISLSARKRRSKKECDSDDSSDKGRARNRRRSSKKHSNLYLNHPGDEKDEDQTMNGYIDTTFRDREYVRTTQRSISWRRKVREFYSAPITTFWLWSLSFYIFLISLCYTLLVMTPRFPSWVEWYLISYVVVWLFELLRKLVMIIMIDRKQKMWRKITMYFGNYRNGVLLFATASYAIGFCIRCNPSSRMVGRVILICNSVLWSLKLLDYLRVFRQLGPYITMAAEMIPRMLPILVMLFVSLLSFGLVRESITYPDEHWHWLLVRNIFYKPYFMLYGEVYAPEIDTCGDEMWDEHLEQEMPITGLTNITGEGCVPGYFIAPIFMTVFMLIANVLLMNTMVACCTYVFEHNVENTQEIWLFERYSQVMEYDSTPFIPPPFTILFHLYWLFRWLRVRNFSRKNLLDASLKLFLSEEEVEKIHSFEEECIEDMEKEKDIRKQSSNDERIHRTAERSDQILNRMTIVENAVRTDVRNLDLLLKAMEARHKDEMDALRLMNLRLEQLLKAQLGTTPPPDEGTPDPASTVLPKEYSRTFEKKPRRRTQPDLFMRDASPPLSSPRRRSVPRVTIADDASKVPSIVFDLVDKEGDSEEKKDKTGNSSQRSAGAKEAATDSENEMISTESCACPLPKLEEHPLHGQHHEEYTSIADRIRLDRNLYSETPHFPYEPEPMCTEEDSETHPNGERHSTS